MENVGFNLLDFGVFRRIIHNTAGQMALQFIEGASRYSTLCGSKTDLALQFLLDYRDWRTVSVAFLELFTFCFSVEGGA